jgi:hypothetical protein
VQPRPDITAALTATARSINQEASLEDTLTTIAQTAQLSLPGFDYVGISTIDRSVNVEAGQPPATWSGTLTRSSTSSNSSRPKKSSQCG